MIGTAGSLTYQSHLIFLKRVHPAAKMPSQAEGDVGFDVSCVEDFVAPAGKVTLVPTGLQPAQSIEPMLLANKVLATPFMKIEGRSGLASNGIFPVGGIVDPRYRGEIKVALFNSTDVDREFKAGDRIAQFVIYYTLATTGTHTQVKFLETDTVSETDRGDKGFGSSGR